MTPQKLIDMKIGFNREILNHSKIHLMSNAVSRTGVVGLVNI